jgi:hypothetical protein
MQLSGLAIAARWRFAIRPIVAVGPDGGRFGRVGFSIRVRGLGQLGGVVRPITQKFLEAEVL